VDNIVTQKKGKLAGRADWGDGQEITQENEGATPGKKRRGGGDWGPDRQQDRWCGFGPGKKKWSFRR